MIRGVVGRILGVIVWIWARTLRVKLDVDGALPADRPWVLVLFHGKQCPLLAWKQRRETTVMVSLSEDGALQARILGMLGYDVVRGSSSRGGARGLAALVRRMRGGRDGVFAVDGPRGPYGVVKPGALLAARATGAVIVPMGSAIAGGGRVLERTWDRYAIAWPFSRVAVTLGPALSPEADPEAVAQAIADANARAETMVAAPRRVRGGLLALFLLLAGCMIDKGQKDRFTQTDYTVNDTQPWAGEMINVDIDGVPIADNGGVTVIADGATKTVTATARLLAYADLDDKMDADLTIAEARGTFAFSRPAGGLIELDCHHGSTHGSSIGTYSGCEYVEVHVPLGSVTQTVNVKVISGDGTVTLSLAAATIGTVTANASGAVSDIVANVPVTKGASVDLVSTGPGAITLTLPKAFSADKIALDAGAGGINDGPFAGLGATRGTAGAGLASLIAVTQGGSITLAGD